ncbi:patatin-like phospholipase family protein [Alcanivorax marinus]|uniref:Patatin-like phospholipase family protein n=1 Tax=Alloalcanivorax marinus TaxID=1177169 RepID=A0A9Q3UP29_9GAMM|nr:patatin-like phospholipase family protein [Alloalcanivorax marinus]MCC4309985.1 patatin-like phospholipase family protein [Alloalcanivorax marinus]
MPAIHTREPALILRAGAQARQHLLDHGLRADDVDIVPGAAGGPKAVGLAGLDRAVFGDFLPRAPRPRTLIGASIGSWRFAAVAGARDGRDAAHRLARLADLYTSQRFPKGVTPREVSRRCEKMLADLLADSDDRILTNPDYRLVVVVIRSRRLISGDRPLGLGLGLAGVIGGNLLSRRALAAFMERGLAYTGEPQLPLEALRDFATHAIPLDVQNLRALLLASAAIPMVLEGVRDIPGAPPGVYRDGGLLDYHLDLPYRSDGLVLYPHFTDRVIPGWFDKPLRWRNGDPGRLARTLLVAPSADYLARLPHGKLPDRTDFKRYQGDDPGRERTWRRAIDESRRLGDEFLELVEKGVGDRLLPLAGDRRR